MRGQLHQSFFFYVCFLFYCRSELPISKIVPPKTQQQQQLNNKSIPLPYISFSFNFLTFRQKMLGQLSQQLTSITHGLCPYFFTSYRVFNLEHTKLWRRKKAWLRQDTFYCLFEKTTQHPAGSCQEIRDEVMDFATLPNQHTTVLMNYLFRHLFSQTDLYTVASCPVLLLNSKCKLPAEREHFFPFFKIQKSKLSVIQFNISSTWKMLCFRIPSHRPNSWFELSLSPLTSY